MMPVMQIYYHLNIYPVNGTFIRGICDVAHFSARGQDLGR